MKIYIGADHRGFNLRQKLLEHLKTAGYDLIDEGDKQLNQDNDYPQFAGKVANAILASTDPEPRGILICGSGQGMCMAANRYKGIRAALGHSVEAARSTRNDDDSNVLCLPADLLEADKAYSIVKTWLETPFAGAERFRRRNQEMDNP